MEVPRTIEYYFSIGSPWAYLGLMELKDLAERHVARVEPFLTTLSEENGGIPSASRPEVRRSYARQDLK